MESSTKRRIIISTSIIILMVLTIVTIPEEMSAWWLLFAAFTSIATVGGILQIIATVKNEQKKEKKKETSQPPPGKEIIPSKLPEISKMIKECPIVQRSEVMKKYFQGKEVEWSGKIFHVEFSGKNTKISIRYNLPYTFVAIFSGNKDKRLELLKGGEKITVRGEMDEFIDSVYQLMILKNCEIISLQR